MAKLTFKQFAEKMQQMIKERAEYQERIKTLKDPVNDQLHFKELNYQIETAFQLFFSKAAITIPQEKRFEVFKSILPESEHRAFFQGCVTCLNTPTYKDKRLLEYVQDEKTKKDLSLANIAELHAAQANINYTEMALQAVDGLDKLPPEVSAPVREMAFNSMAKVCGNLLGKTKNPSESYMNAIAKLGEFEEFDMDECVPEENEYLAPPLHTKDFTNHPSHEAIDKLIKDTEDKEYAAMLKDIDDNVLVFSDSKLTDFAFPVAEFSAKDEAHAQRDAVLEELYKNPAYKDVIVPSGDSSYVSKFEEMDTEKYQEYVRDIKNSTVSFKEEYKEQVMDILDGLDRIHHFDDREEAEQGIKVYGLKGILDAKLAVQKAIEEGNKEKIEEAYKRYKNTEAIMDKMLEAAGKMDPLSDSMPVNVSVSRNSAMAPKYVMDMVRVSRVNAVYQLWCLSRRSGIPAKEFLDHPETAYPKVLKDMIGGKTAINSFLKENSIADIIVKSQDSLKMREEVYNKDGYTFGNIQRSIEGLVACSNDNKGNSVWEAKLKQTILEPGQSLFLGYESSMFASKADEVILNLFYCEPKDIDALKMNPNISAFRDPYTNKKLTSMDGGEYLADGKTSIYRVISRMADTIRTFEKDAKGNEKATKLLHSAVRKTAERILANPFIEKDNATTKLLEGLQQKASSGRAFGLNGMKEYKSYSDKHAPDKVLEDIKYENYSQKSIYKSFQVMTAMKKRYDDSWFFMKWFSSSTKALKTGAESIRQGMIDKGIQEEYIAQGEKHIANSRMDSLSKLCQQIENTMNDDLEYINNGVSFDLDGLENPQRVQNEINLGQEEEKEMDDSLDIGNVDREKLFEKDNEEIKKN